MNERDVEFLEGAVRRHLPSARVIWTAREGRISDAELRRRCEEADLREEAEALVGRGIACDELRQSIAMTERCIAEGCDGLTEAELAKLPRLLEILRWKLGVIGGGRT